MKSPFNDVGGETQGVKDQRKGTKMQRRMGVKYSSRTLDKAEIPHTLKWFLGQGFRNDGRDSIVYD